MSELTITEHEYLEARRREMNTDTPALDRASYWQLMRCYRDHDFDLALAEHALRLIRGEVRS